MKRSTAESALGMADKRVDHKRVSRKRPPVAGGSAQQHQLQKRNKVDKVRGDNRSDNRGYANNEETQFHTEEEAQAEEGVLQLMGSENDEDAGGGSSEEENARDSTPPMAAKPPITNGRQKTSNVVSPEEQKRKKEDSGVNIYGLSANDFLVIKNHIGSNLFAKVKFISSDDQLRFGEKIAENILRATGSAHRYSLEKRAVLWECIRPTVKGILNQKRSNISGEIKKAFFRKE